jgi:hypothetical protein
LGHFFQNLGKIGFKYLFTLAGTNANADDANVEAK